MSYRKLDVWQIARTLSIEVHEMTLRQLPRFEMFEEGAQIRRSSKSIRSNIVEGYGRRRYKQDFLRFLTYAHASCDETVDHLEALWETQSLKDEPTYGRLHAALETLGSKLYRFIEGVKQQHQSVREEGVAYETRTGDQP